MSTTTRNQSVFRALHSLSLRSLATRKRMIGFGVVGSVILLAAVVEAGNTHFDYDRVATEFVNRWGLFLLLPFGCLLFASTALGEPREDKTMVYIWLRPVPATIPVSAAFAATITASAPFTIGVLSASAAIIGTEQAFAGALLATVLGTLAYSAVFLALGLRVRRALVWGALYILIWEGFVASVGGVPGKLALRTYTQSAMVHTAGVDPDFSEVAYPTSIIVPILVTIVALAYTVHRFRSQDVD